VTAYLIDSVKPGHLPLFDKQKKVCFGIFLVAWPNVIVVAVADGGRHRVAQPTTRLLPPRGISRCPQIRFNRPLFLLLSSPPTPKLLLLVRRPRNPRSNVSTAAATATTNLVVSSLRTAAGATRMATRRACALSL
jgi:hypothetical protein